MRNAAAFMLLFLCSSFNANAQLGNLFKKLGDAIDGAINSSKEAPKEDVIKPKESGAQSSTEGTINTTAPKRTKYIFSQLSDSDAREYLTGRWGSTSTCDIKNKPAGIYLDWVELREDPKKDRHNSSDYVPFKSDGKGPRPTLMVRVFNPTTGKQEKIFYYLTQFEFPLLAGTSTIALTYLGPKLTQESLIEYQRNAPAIAIDLSGGILRFVDKNGDLLKESQTALEPHIKCDVDYILGDISDPSLNVKNSFGIKGLYLGSPLPNSPYVRCENLVLLEGHNLKVCGLKTTILGADYFLSVLLLDDKIYKVSMIDLLALRQQARAEKHTSVRYNALENLKKPLTEIKDFPSYLNLLIGNIAEKIGGREGDPTSQKELSDIHEGLDSYAFALREFGSLSPDDKAQFSSILTNITISLPPSSRLNSYVFGWVKDNYRVDLKAKYPVSKDLPNIYYSVIISYEDTELIAKVKLIKDRKVLSEQQAQQQALEKKKQEIIQMENKKNEVRRQDF